MAIIDLGDLDEELETTPYVPYTPAGALSPPPGAFGAPLSLPAAFDMIPDADALFDFTDTTLTSIQQVYIVAFATSGIKTKACKVARVPYTIVEKWIAENEEFKNTLNSCVAMVRDTLEGELYRRAMMGSDRLLISALKATDPEKYNTTRRVEQQVSGHLTMDWASVAKAAVEEIKAETVPYTDVADTTLLLGDDDDV